MSYHKQAQQHHGAGGGRWGDQRRGAGYSRWRPHGQWRQWRDGESGGRQQGEPRSTSNHHTGDDMRKTLETVTNALSVLAERIQKLERGPDQPTDRPRSGHRSEAGPLPQIKSNNDEFASCVKDMYRMVQLGHHGENWSRLPKSLAQRLDKFADDIKPPMLDDEFRTVIKNETRAYGDRICDAVRQHIDRKRAETEMAAATRDRTDLDRAKEIADKQLARRLGRRLEETKRRQLLDQAAGVIGSGRRESLIESDGFRTVVNRKQPVTVSPSNAGTPSKKRKVESSSVSILNRFSVLQSHDDDDEIAREEVEPIDQDDEDAEATVAVHTVTANTIDRSDDARDAMILGDNSATAVASYLTAAKTGVQTETTEKQVAVAGADTETVVVAEVHGRTLARGRSVSLERPSRTLRPSTQTMRTGNGVVVHTGTDKEKWRIVPEESTKVLVIGDSNVKRFSSTPRGWEVHCLPGARLVHVNRILEDVLIQESKSLSVVYVQVGINHKTEDPEKYKRQVEWLMMLNSQTPVQVAFVGVPRPPSATPSERQNIDALNEMMSSAFVHQYVQPIEDDHVEILKEDTYKIHHTAYTSNRILTSIRKHAQLVNHLN